MRHDVQTKTLESKPTGGLKRSSAGRRWLMLLLSFIFTAGFSLTAHGAGGDAVWQAGDVRTGKQEAKASVVDGSGNVIVTGYQNLSGSTNDDYWTVKFNADGTIAWRASYDKVGASDQATAIAVDSENNVIVTGYVWNGLDTDIQTIKYRGTDGTVLWQNTFNGVAHGNDVATAIAVDNLNNIYIGGYSQNSVGNEDYLIIKYSASGPNPDGTPLWKVTYDGSGNGPDKLASLAVRDIPVNNGVSGIAASGYSWNGSDFDLMTLKYDLNGTKLWEVRHGSSALSGTKDDQGKYVRIDPAGNVIVAGYVSNTVDKDIYSAKYNGATGGLSWERTFNGTYDDEPNGLFVDANGDVYLTGYTWTLTAHNDFYTAKYSGADGNILWENSFNSSGSNDDITSATGIVVDESGDVFVTGYSITGDNFDFQTIKYRKDNGTELWHTSYNSSAGKNDRPIGIGLSPTGHVYVAGWSDMTSSLDSGAADISETDKTIVETSTKTWTANQWAGYRIKITGGANSGASRSIQGNTATMLTVTSPFVNAIAAGDTYYIYDVEDIDYTLLKYDPGQLNRPTGLATQTLSNTSVRLSWADNSANEDGFNVYRKAGEFGAWQKIAPVPPATVTTVDPNVTTFDDTGLTANTYYYYRITATNATLGESYPSDPAKALTVFVTYGVPSLTYLYDGPAPVDVNGDKINAIAVGPDNNPVVTGKSMNNEPYPSDDYYTVKLNRTDLTPVWSDRYNDGDNEYDEAKCLSVANDNSVIVSGYASLFFPPAGRNINSVYTMKYPSAGPTPLWHGQYNGPGAIDDRATNAVASTIDGSDDSSIIIGFGKNTANNDDIYVIKYAADPARDQFDNALAAWSATPFDRGGNDQPNGVILDTAGNVYVTGYSQNGASGNYDIFTAKYCGSATSGCPAGKNPGDIIWYDLYDSGYGDDIGQSLALDAAGDLYVTGFATNSAANRDFYTIKYSGSTATAQKLWSGGGRSFDGTANGDDEAVAVRVDPIDDAIVVGGTTLTAAGDHDVTLIRYTPAGDLVWQKTHQRPANDDLVKAMGMDSSGNLFVTGSTSNGLTSDSMTLKYDYDGNIIGATVFDGSGHSFDESSAIAVNSLGEAFIAGNTANANGNDDYLVYRMAAELLPAPSPLTVISGYTTVTFNWPDNSTIEDGYTIQRKVGSCSPANQWSQADVISTLPVNSTTFSESGLNPGAIYCYRIQAFKNTGLASRWIEKNVTTPLPAAPTGFSATPFNTTRIDLAWSDATTGETGFEIERCSGESCDFSAIDPGFPVTVAANATTYSDNTLCNAVSYRYRILAFKTALWESPFSMAAATAPAPVAPGGLTATRSSEAQVNLSWSDNTADETGFEIERCAGAGCTSFAKIDAVAAGVTSYNDTIALAPDTTYRYQVRAYKTAACGWFSSYSPIAQAVTSNTVPSGLTAVAASTTEVNLDWTDNTGSETGFAVERCTGPGCNFTTLDSGFPQITPANARAYADSGVCNSLSYSYRVKAVNQGLGLDGGGAWTRRVPLAITNFQPFFQTRVTIAKAAEMQPDFRDIRFFDVTSNRELPYWIESKVDGVSATVWLKTGAQNNVYLYYGNASALDASSGANTFEFFDDFNAAVLSAQWASSTTASGNITLGSGTVTLDSPSFGNATISKGFTPPYRVSSRVKVADTYDAANIDRMRGLSSGSSWDIGFFDDPSYPAIRVYFNGWTAVTIPVNQYFRWNALHTGGATNSWEVNSDSGSPIYAMSYSGTPTGVHFSAGDTGGGNGRFSLDWVFVRKYVATEPAASVGSPVELPSGSVFTMTGTWDGLYSNLASATTPTPLAPTTLTATRASEVQLNLTWTDRTTDETGFRIDRCAGAGCDFSTKVTMTAGPNVTTWQDTGLVPGTTYRYQVRAYKTASCNGGWETENSNVAAAEATLLPPAGQTSTASIATNREDIRITDSDGTTLVSQWMQPPASGSIARPYAKIPLIPVGTKTVYLYYGNAVAPAVDNGDATFEFFDDFKGTAIDTNKWTLTFSPGFTVSDDLLHGTNTTGRLTSNFNLAVGNMLTIKAKTTTPAANGSSIGGAYGGSYNNLGFTLTPYDGGYSHNNYYAPLAGPPPANNIGYSLYATDATTTTIQAYNWDTAAWYISPTAVPFSIAGKPIALGRTYFFDNYAGQIYQTDWDWMLVRKIANPAPTSASNAKEYGSYTIGGDNFAVRIPVVITHTATGATSLTNYQPVIPVLDTSPLATDRITFSWSDTTASETGFVIERCTGAGCDFSNKSIFSVGPNVTTYPDRAVDLATTYCYRVKATLGSGDSAFTAPACSTTSAPVPPANFAAAVSGTRIDLTWSDTTTNEDAFVVERCTGAACDFSTVDSGFPVTLGLNTTTFADTSACSGSYTYRVKSVKPWIAGWPGYAAPVSATLTAPLSPGGLSATRISEKQINLAWTDTTTDETGYRVERCTLVTCGETDFVQLGSDLPANATSFSDTGLTPGATYTYRVKAFKAGGCGWVTLSGTASATTTVLAPGSLTATAASTTQVNLGWVDTAVSENNFVVERCSGASCDFSSLDAGFPFNVPANSTSNADKTVCAGVVYTYRVKAVNRGLSFDNGGSWTRRVPLTISNFQPNFQTRVTINYNSPMRTDFADIRFYDATANSELPYWVESKTDGVSATVLFTTPASNSVYLYYGNPDAASASSINNTLGSGLMGYLPFSEAAGTTSGASADLSGQNNNVTLTNFATPYGIVSAGKSGTGLSLNGSSFAKNDAVSLPTGSVATVEAWIYPTSYADGSYNGIVSWGPRSTTGASLLLAIQNSGRPSMATWGNDFVPTTGTTATLNAWNHIAVVVNGTAVTLYMNGQPISGTLPVMPNFQSLNFSVGTTDYPGRYFNGRIDEVRIYNRALSGQEIASRAAAAPSVTLGGVEQSAGFTFSGTFDSSPYSNSASVTTPQPVSPSGLTAVRVSEAQINLAWTRNTTDESGFKIERCAGPGCSNFVQIATVGPGVTAYSNDSGLVPDTTYRYQVRAYKTASCGWDSGYSAIAQAVTTNIAPSGLSATAVNTTQVNLAWTDNAGSETGFAVERCTGAGCNFATLDTGFPVIVGASATAWSDTTPCNATTYTYRVMAVNKGLSLDGGGVWTKRKPLTISNFQPNFQTKLTIAYDAAMKADFSDIRFYDDTSGKELPYWVERKTDGVTATFWVKTAASNAVYLYYGNPAAASMSSGTRTFEFYDDFSGTSIDAAKWVKVDSGGYYSQNNELLSSGGSGNWNTGIYSAANFTRPFVFEIAHYRSGGQYMMIGAKNTGSGISYTDLTHAAYPIYDGGGNRLAVYEDGAQRGDSLKSIASDTWQYYKFEVLNSGANFYHGVSTDAYTLFYGSGYSAASPLKVAVANYNQAFKLDNARVRKYAATEPAVTLGAVEQSAGFTFVNTWQGPYSATAMATTFAPVVPTGLSATAVTDTRIDLTWVDTNPDETGYKVERCAGESCSDFAPLAQVGANTGSFTDNGLVPSASYCYRVQAYKTTGCGWEQFYSNPSCVKTISQHPDSLTATALNSFKIQLNWSDLASDEDGFEIEKLLWNERWLPITIVGPNVTTYTDTIGIEPLKEYRYRVRAFRGTQKSPYSNEALVSCVRDGNTIYTTPAFTPGDTTCP